jgi:hypothetical protein
MQALGAQCLGQQMAQKVGARAQPGGGVAELAFALPLCQRLLQGGRAVGRHHQHGGGVADLADGGEALYRVIRAGRLHQRRQHIGADVAQQQGVAIVPGLRDVFGADGATRPGLVFHDHFTLQRLGQPLGHDARHAIGGAAGGTTDHDGHRLVGLQKVLG